MEEEMEGRVIPNLSIFAIVGPIVWFVFGAYMLITGHFQANNFINAIVALTVYFTFGTPISSFLAFIPAIPYILLAFITLFIAKNVPIISWTAKIFHYLLIIIFILITVVWTIFIGNWAIGAISKIL